MIYIYIAPYIGSLSVFTILAVCKEVHGRALHFVPMGVHLVYMGAQCRSNEHPWAQNVELYITPQALSLVEKAGTNGVYK